MTLFEKIMSGFTENSLKELTIHTPLPTKKTQKGLISIIIPTLNAGKHLEVLLPSLTDQTYRKFEIIINDDIKTNDNTASIIQQFSKIQKIVYLHTNDSMAQGRRISTLSAQGEYLLHLDADMKLSPDVLKQCIVSIKTYDALVIPEVSYGQGFWANAKIFERSMYVGDDTIESARFFRSNVYRSVGGHNEKMVLSEDKDLDLRVRKSGHRVGRINAPIYHNEGNFSITKSIKKKYFYGRTASILMLTNPAYALKYGNIVFRPAFFRNWRRLISHPLLALSVFFMKLLETLAGLAGMISAKIPFLGDDVKVKIWQ